MCVHQGKARERKQQAFECGELRLSSCLTLPLSPPSHTAPSPRPGVWARSARWRSVPCWLCCWWSPPWWTCSHALWKTRCVCVCVCVCVAVTVAVHVSTSRRTLLISPTRRTMSRRRSAPPVRPGTYSVRAATAAVIFSLPLLPSARAHAVYVFLCLSLFSRTSRTHRTGSAAAIASESVPLLPFHPSVAATRRERALTLLRCVCVCVCVLCRMNSKFNAPSTVCEC